MAGAGGEAGAAGLAAGRARPSRSSAGSLSRRGSFKVALASSSDGKIWFSGSMNGAHSPGLSAGVVTASVFAGRSGFGDFVCGAQAQTENGRQQIAKTGSSLFFILKNATGSLPLIGAFCNRGLPPGGGAFTWNAV